MTRRITNTCALGLALALTAAAASESAAQTGGTVSSGVRIQKDRGGATGSAGGEVMGAPTGGTTGGTTGGGTTGGGTTGGGSTGGGTTGGGTTGGGTTTPTTARVDVTPASASLETGKTQQLTATARDASGAERSGRSFTWSSSAPGVATVNGSGLVTAVSVGTATITARADGVNGTATVTVTNPAPATVSRVVVTPAVSRLVYKGKNGTDEAVFTATLFDAGGRQLSGRSCSWSGGAPLAGSGKAIVTVTQLSPTTARAKASREGATGISATCDGKTGTAAITVIEDDD